MSVLLVRVAVVSAAPVCVCVLVMIGAVAVSTPAKACDTMPMRAEVPIVHVHEVSVPSMSRQ
jgi:hypothetical protein